MDILKDWSPMKIKLMNTWFVVLNCLNHYLAARKGDKNSELFVRIEPRE